MFDVDNYDANSILIPHEGIIYTLKIRCSDVLVTKRFADLQHSVADRVWILGISSVVLSVYEPEQVENHQHSKYRTSK
jgi:hypothetical protein